MSYNEIPELEKNDFSKIAWEEFEKANSGLPDGEKLQDKIYSDIIDAKDGYQYVNLIQEGGGVWGLALVGYTYILELSKIRFLKLAGTSAGAINTMFLASVLHTNHPNKSAYVVSRLVKLNMFSFVDGHWFVAKMIKNVIVQKNFVDQLIFSLKWLIILAISSLFLSSFLQWNDHYVNRLAILMVVIMSSLVYLAFFRAKKHFEADKNKDDGGILEYLEDENKAEIKSNDVKKNVATLLKALILPIVLSLGYFFIPKSAICIQNIEILIIGYISILIIIYHDFFDFEYVTFFALFNLMAILIGFDIGTRLSNTNNNFLYISLFFLALAILVYYTKLKAPRWMFYIILLFVFFFAFIWLGATNIFREKYVKFSYISIIAVITGALTIFFVGGFIVFLFEKFNSNEFGINPGINFHKWLKFELKKLKQNNTADDDFILEDLQNNWLQNASSIVHRNILDSEKEPVSVENLKTFDIESDDCPVVIITSEITTQNKVELPKMHKAYWQKEKPVVVADFVRASMSIPLFFNPFVKTGINEEMRNYGKTWFGDNYASKVHTIAHFIDGGVLSNFPYSIFHRPKIKKTRLPTFGIRLFDSSTEIPKGFKSLGQYLMTIFNTSRYYFDKDFLNKNKYYKECIREIDLKGYNWLNFFLTEAEKKEMFKIGVLAAIKFLNEFDWKSFKEKRDEGIEKNY